MIHYHIDTCTHMCFNQNVGIRRNESPKWEFLGYDANGTLSAMMLNTDMGLKYELNLDPSTAEAGCTIDNDASTNCTYSSTASIFQEYADVSRHEKIINIQLTIKLKCLCDYLIN